MTRGTSREEERLVFGYSGDINENTVIVNRFYQNGVSLKPFRINNDFCRIVQKIET